MIRRTQKRFHISYGTDPVPDRSSLLVLFGAFLLASAPHVERLPWWLWLLTAVVFGWRYRIMNAGAHIPGIAIRVLLIGSLLFLLLRHFHTLLGRDVGVAMLIGFTAMKLLELKTFRDSMLVVFLCFFIVLTSFLYSQSVLLGGYLLAVVVGLVTVLYYLNHSEHRRLSGMLLRAGTLVALALPLAMVIFVLFPRIPAGILGLPNDSHGGLTGMSDTMRPGSIHSLSLSNEVAFRAIFSDQVPDMAERYWRGIVMEVYRDGTWSEATSSQHVTSVKPTYATQDVVDYTVMPEPSNRKWLFALDIPVQADSAKVQWHQAMTLRTREAIRQRIMVDVSSATQLRYAALTKAERSTNTELASDISPRVRELARDMYARAEDQTRYIGMVLEYFRDNFAYSLSPPALGDRPVEQFLFDTRTGYCEHFASAFTVLMRLSGIPARVVTGYQGGEWNTQADYLIVRQSDAHAWSEVWLPGEGWQRVDPTFAILPERIEYGMDAVRLLQAEDGGRVSISGDAGPLLSNRPWQTRVWHNARLFWDGINTRWYRWVIGYGGDQQRRLLDWLGFAGGGMRTLVSLMVGVIFVILLVQGWLLLRGRKRAEPVVRLYGRFCDRLSRIGLPKAPGEGPCRYAGRVVRQRPDLAKHIDEITGRYVALRYAQTGDRNDLATLKLSIRRFRPTRRTPA